MIYQGNLLTFNYTVDDTKKQEYVIPAENVDTDRMKGMVKPNEQSVRLTNTLFLETSLHLTLRPCLFLEETEDLRYKVTFSVMVFLDVS